MSRTIHFYNAFIKYKDKELPKSDEEELRKLRTIWEMIKSENDKKKK